MEHTEDDQTVSHRHKDEVTPESSGHLSPKLSAKNEVTNILAPSEAPWMGSGRAWVNTKSV